MVMLFRLVVVVAAEWWAKRESREQHCHWVRSIHPHHPHPHHHQCGWLTVDWQERCVVWSCFGHSTWQISERTIVVVVVVQ